MPTDSSNCSARPTSPIPPGRRTASTSGCGMRMCELADELAAALVDGDEPDVVETQAVAAELHDLLRPYV